MLVLVIRTQHHGRFRLSNLKPPRRKPASEVDSRTGSSHGKTQKPNKPDRDFWPYLHAVGHAAKKMGKGSRPWAYRWRKRCAEEVHFAATRIPLTHSTGATLPCRTASATGRFRIDTGCRPRGRARHLLTPSMSSFPEPLPRDERSDRELSTEGRSGKLSREVNVVQAPKLTDRGTASARSVRGRGVSFRRRLGSSAFRCPRSRLPPRRPA